MRPSPPPLLIFAALPVLISAAINNDFSAYPTGSQPCLGEAAAISECTGDTGSEINDCLCSNGGGFIDAAAKCVARESPHDLTAVYRQMRINCQGTGNAIIFTEGEFKALGDSSATSTERTTTPLQTQTQGISTPTNVPEVEEETDDLSTGAMVGIGLGVGFGAIAAALAAWFIWAYSRRRHSLVSEVGGPPNIAPTLPRDPAAAEYAQYNKQDSVVELSLTEWKPGRGGGDSNGGGSNGAMAPAGFYGKELPAELPADGLSDIASLPPSSADGGGDGISPLTYSQASGQFSRTNTMKTMNTYPVSPDWSGLGPSPWSSQAPRS